MVMGGASSPARPGILPSQKCEERHQPVHLVDVDLPAEKSEDVIEGCWTRAGERKPPKPVRCKPPAPQE